MYAHAATQENLARLAGRGVRIVEPAEGELASGLRGKGRMAEPDEIAAFVGRLLTEKKKTLARRRPAVTPAAPPDPMDPARLLAGAAAGARGASS